MNLVSLKCHFECWQAWHLETCVSEKSSIAAMSSLRLQKRLEMWQEQGIFSRVWPDFTYIIVLFFAYNGLLQVWLDPETRLPTPTLARTSASSSRMVLWSRSLSLSTPGSIRPFNSAVSATFGACQTVLCALCRSPRRPCGAWECESSGGYSRDTGALNIYSCNTCKVTVYLYDVINHQFFRQTPVGRRLRRLARGGRTGRPNRSRRCGEKSGQISPPPLWMIWKFS